ncbi:MAG: hypothetical protein NC243_06410 [Lachnoclostridium sp.]|nr:hypothetical protein [Lachnoclostridium sp.]
MERKKREDLAVIAMGIAICYFIYLAVMSELPDTYADYNGHTYVYLPVFTGESFLKGWRTVPYCMWHVCVLALNLLLHIPLEVSVAYVSCFFQLFTYLVIYWMIQKYTWAKGNGIGSVTAAVLAAGLSIIQGLSFSWLDAGGRFLGIFSANPIHNPTQMAVRPFVLLCFALVIDIWGAQKDKGYQGIFFKVENGLRRYYGYLAVILLLSAMAKPVFAAMFIPAVGLLMLWDWIRCILQKDGSAAAYFKQCLAVFFCAVPTVLYVLLSAASYYIWGEIYQGDSSLILTKWMEVWKLYSENVILSIGLGMAFPLFMILIDGRFFIKEAMGRLALTGYLTGVLESAVMGEANKLEHANYIWPMMCGMLLLWITALLRLVELERTQTDTKVRRILVDFGWFLFCAHVLCGILYIREMIGG